MKAYHELEKEDLLALKADLQAAYEKEAAKGLKLDMSRGKPAPAQLDLGMELMEVLQKDSSMLAADGIDVRNYGDLTGIPEAKQLMAQIMGVSSEQVIVYNNASLSIMYDMISRSMTHGVLGNTPWCRLEKVKFLCPVPGYDRHFGITAHFGIEMIPIPMSIQGPDMDLIEQLTASDESIKGIWCVPKYSNPQGVVYSDECVRRFANLHPAASDFRLFWDNAYAVHYLDTGHQDTLLDIFAECEKAGTQDMVYEFCSTSKISFAGGGISALAASKANLDEVIRSLTIRTIGSDKINQLRHARYYKDLNGVIAHMAKHAAIIRPKFQAVGEILERELSGLGIGTWVVPNGGYFISFDAMEGCAQAIVTKCKEAGMVLTGAGATYPYGKDPLDTNIRIAPTYPTLEEMKQAAALFALCVKLVSAEKLLEKYTA
jgi:DNA-binding transcriptional MocR family regulator